MRSPVPAEDELVQVAVDVLLPQPVEGAERPKLEVREDPVDPRHEDVGGHPTHDATLVLDVPEAPVGL
jgi:hypothetical protein